MFIENLSEHEVGTLIAALKQFRARRASAISRTDWTPATDTVSELLAKLEGLLLTSLTATDPALHGLVFNR